MTLSVTVEEDRTRANPTPAVRTVFDIKSGELSIAVTARSGRSNEDHVTDPKEVPLNWIPIQGQGRTDAFSWNTISAPARPFAARFPSTNSPTRRSHRSVGFGVTVRWSPGGTQTRPVSP